MAVIRPTGGGAGKPVLPAANELMSEFGLGPRQAAGYLGLTGGMMPNQFMGSPVAASSGEFFEVLSLTGVKDEFFDPMDYDDVAERNLAGEPVWTLKGDEVYIDENGNPVDKVRGRRFYDIDTNDETGREEVVIPGLPAAYGAEGDEGPAKLTVVPTTSSNPARPRTVAAGYDKVREVITVVFRDGTFYNYYGVTPREWQDFKARVSKGRYIYKYLDYKQRGPADLTTLPSYARNTLYRVARSLQLKNYGLQPTKRKKR
jgi:KTSC domain